MYNSQKMEYLLNAISNHIKKIFRMLRKLTYEVAATIAEAVFLLSTVLVASGP